MASALIGYTGFVGTTLRGQTSFDDLYRSTNIGDIEGKHYDLIVCAGAPAQKWKANQQPEADRENLAGLMARLGTVSAERFVLISTIDVYPDPSSVDENSSIAIGDCAPYGRHRLELERFVRGRFEQAFIVRLPGLFGRGLRKNFIFDLLGNPDALHLTDARSRFQFYDMSRLWGDLGAVLTSGVGLVNFATKPVEAAEVARRAFGVSFSNQTAGKPPAAYDMRTVHAGLFGRTGDYMASGDEVLDQITRYVAAEKGTS